MRLRSQLPCEIHSVKTGYFAIELNIAARLVSHAAKPPEEVEMPELPVEFTVGDDAISQFFLLADQFRHILLRKILETKKTAYEVGPLRNLNAFDYF